MKVLSCSEQKSVNGGFLDIALGFYAGRAGWDFSKVMAAEFAFTSVVTAAYISNSVMIVAVGGLASMVAGAISYKIGSCYPLPVEPSVQHIEIESI